jgi:hypothetical protein
MEKTFKLSRITIGIEQEYIYVPPPHLDEEVRAVATGLTSPDRKSLLIGRLRAFGSTVAWVDQMTLSLL